MNILSIGSKLGILFIILLLIGLMGFAIFGNRVPKPQSPLVGKDAPSFALDLFSGNEIDLSELKGKTVLLNFWASWCMPCRQEALALERSWLKYKDKDVIFIGVNVWDEQSGARAFLGRYGGTYIHGSDPEEKIQVDYGVGGVPETFFISPEGRITDKYNGPLTEEIIDYYLNKTMNVNYSS